MDMDDINNNIKELRQSIRELYEFKNQNSERILKTEMMIEELKKDLNNIGDYSRDLHKLKWQMGLITWFVSGISIAVIGIITKYAMSIFIK